MVLNEINKEVVKKDNLPTLGELVDRLSIHQLKGFYVGE